MSIDKAKCRQYLGEFNFKKLLIEELGWDRFDQEIELSIDNVPFNLSGIAEKREFGVFICLGTESSEVPDRSTRLKIERQVEKFFHEHLIVFINKTKTTQIWQWVKREQSKPLAVREQVYVANRSNALILQLLEGLEFTLEEEESLNLHDVTTRIRTALDVDRVTKRFYDQFKKEHTNFLKFIDGIEEIADREWYASVMLNRLMFVYFIQRKGFLDGDQHYLRNRLQRCQEERGRDKFYSFYRYFLLRLFHEGLGGKPPRTKALDDLLGKIPYLNGGLFDVHELEKPERYGKAIQIPDSAFERVFTYFDQYQWHLDERPLRADNEINPDVLGYIFEKYINQKQMGAYYSKEDITEYISKNTLLPFLFSTAHEKCKIAFENPNGPTVWDLLRINPDRYIFPAVKHGVTWNYIPQDINKGNPLNNPLTLPQNIMVGLDTSKPNLIKRRKEWNNFASSDYALATETWRDVVFRRQYYDELKKQLYTGEVRTINDFITYNLDIRQFAQDVIENCEGPDLLRSFWHAIENITILDPTCGSGAFLFAALNILESLYEACLERMKAFLEDEAAKTEQGKCNLTKHGYPLLPNGKLEDFSILLDRVADHPSSRYFIFKSIILNNLFGVDIMEEAVEICKLRLFLKLAAQVEPDLAKPNLGIEPLPDIDFNIRAGNTLIGFITLEQIRNTLKSDLIKQFELHALEERAAKADIAWKTFRNNQTNEGVGPETVVTSKQELRRNLLQLNDELNRILATEYGVKEKDKKGIAKWKKSDMPFHWFAEFYGIIISGGFDVIIGNPPYLEIREVNYQPHNYVCQDTGAIHAMCIERSASLLHTNGSMSMIVPLSLPSTQRMKPVQEILESRGDAWFANFAWRPAKLGFYPVFTDG